ncbi:hypothetical protein CF326_g4419 [Tilletia indica]|nr:hypothetical protein CF326_g4419 [Tilletia indica]
MARTVENVWNYPRPPALEKIPYNLKVIWNPPPHTGAPPVTLADSNNAWAVKETSHPPTYYFPPNDVNREFLQHTVALISAGVGTYTAFGFEGGQVQLRRQRNSGFSR